MKINSLNPNINIAASGGDTHQNLLLITSKNNLRTNTLKTYDLKSVLSPVGSTVTIPITNSKPPAAVATESVSSLATNPNNKIKP